MAAAFAARMWNATIMTVVAPAWVGAVASTTQPGVVRLVASLPAIALLFWAPLAFGSASQAFLLGFTFLTARQPATKVHLCMLGTSICNQ